MNISSKDRRFLPACSCSALSTTLWASSALLLLLLAACSGGGGGSDDDGDSTPPPDTSAVLFSGSLTEGTSDAVVPISDAAVCALGSCDTTDAAGHWTFSVPGNSYSGGSVAFSFSAAGINAGSTVGGLNPEASAITISFFMESDGTITSDEVEQDIPSQPEPEPDPDDETPLPTDPQDRACEILRRANISIPNHEAVVQIGAASDCPVQINDIIVVGNIHNIPYTYTVTSDAPDALTFDPESEAVTGTQLNKHDGNYLCSRGADFTAVVTATITEYQPDDGLGPITAQEAIALCGRNASVGNTSESVQVTFDLP